MRAGDGDDVLTFIEHYARITKDSIAGPSGAPLSPRDWQRELIRATFARNPATGRRLARTALWGMARKNGKALALDTPIPTPTGWTSMGALVDGDEVFDEQGRVCRVTFATDVMLGHDCYRVEFSDGTAIVADGEHQWAVIDRKGKDRLLTTEQMVGRVRMGSRPTHREHRFSIPTAGPLDCIGRPLPVPAYTLGAWLGDGSRRDGRVTNADAEVWSSITADGYQLGVSEQAGRAETRTVLALRPQLRELGLNDRKSIPPLYLRASTEDRTALLQGLMDTDGSVSPAGQCEFTTTSPALAGGVTELLRSLGAKPTCREKRATIAGRDVGPKWRIQFFAPPGLHPFRIARKGERVRFGAGRSRTRQIIAITPVPSVPVRCIQVDSPSHLYLAGEAMVPTHNTGLVAPIALYGLMLDGEGAEVYSCAADRDQAKLVFSAARRTVELVPELNERLKLYRDVIADPVTGSVYRALSSEAYTKEGLSPTLVLADELHAWPNRDLYDVMALAMGARRDPLMLIVTTAGVRTDSTGKDSIAYALYQYGLRVAAGEVIDPSFFFAWWAAQDGRPVDDAASWEDANPGLDDILDRDELAGQARKALAGGMSESEFRIKRTNLWVASITAALPAGVLERLVSLEPPPDDLPVVLFFDGSFNHDCTALLAATIEPHPRLYVVGCWERPLDDPQWKVPIGEVDAKVRETVRDRKVVEVACDPFRWAQLMEQWEADDLPVFAYPTTAVGRMVPAWAKFYDAVMGERLSHDGDPRLLRHARNTVLKVDRLGPRPVKEHRGSPRSIDLLICAVGAYDRATLHSAQPDPRSVYDTRSPLVF